MKYICKQEAMKERLARRTTTFVRNAFFSFNILIVSSVCSIALLTFSNVLTDCSIVLLTVSNVLIDIKLFKIWTWAALSGCLLTLAELKSDIATMYSCSSLIEHETISPLEILSSHSCAISCVFIVPFIFMKLRGLMNNLYLFILFINSFLLPKECRA